MYKVGKEFIHPSVKEYMMEDIGNLAGLETTDKSSIIKAINELVDKTEDKSMLAESLGSPIIASDSYSDIVTKINILIDSFKSKLNGMGISVEDTDKLNKLINKLELISTLDLPKWFGKTEKFMGYTNKFELADQLIIIGRDFYTIQGYNSGGKFKRYNIDTDEIEDMAGYLNLSRPRGDYKYALGKKYICANAFAQGGHATYTFDVDLKVWTQRTNSPSMSIYSSDRSLIVSSVSKDGLVYCFGNDYQTEQGYIYDDILDTFTKINASPIQKGGVCEGGGGFYFFGYDNFTGNNSFATYVYYYDVKTNTSSRKDGYSIESAGKYTGSVYYRYGCCRCGDYIYYKTNNAKGRLVRYDIANNTHEVIPGTEGMSPIYLAPITINGKMRIYNKNGFFLVD